MENLPLKNDTIESDSDKKDSKAKKKKAGALGSFAVEPKRSKSEEKTTKVLSESLWGKPDKPELNTPKSAESESTAPEEQIDSSEKPYVERELTKANQAEDTEPVEAVERFRNRIIEAGQDSDEALEQTIAELESMPDVEADSIDEAHEDILSEDVQEAPDAAPVEFGEEAVLLNETAAEAEAHDDSATATAAGGAGTPPPPPPPNPTPRSSAAPGGGSGGRGPSGFRPGAAGFNATPAAAVAPLERTVANPNTGGALLVGGIVGYLIGRRRGRIRTEKRLLPIQKKLQKEVTHLQTQLQQKEAKIRALAATKVQEKPRLSPRVEKAPTPTVEKSRERPTQLAEQESELRYVAPTVIAERAPSDRAQWTEVHKAPENNHAPEQIGHMLVVAEAAAAVVGAIEKPRSAETVAAPAVGKSEKFQKTKAEQTPKITIEKNIDTLNRAELMRISEKIIIEGSSLRQIYETKLVGEKGLRRLVKEYLKGGDIKKALRREIVEREIDFERDPGLRDQAQHADAGPKGGGRAATLNDLLQNADVAVGADKEEVAFLKARAAYEVQERAQQKNNQRLMDASFVGIILILMGLVVMLSINRM